MNPNTLSSKAANHVASILALLFVTVCLAACSNIGSAPIYLHVDKPGKECAGGLQAAVVVDTTGQRHQSPLILPSFPTPNGKLGWSDKIADNVANSTPVTATATCFDANGKTIGKTLSKGIVSFSYGKTNSMSVMVSTYIRPNQGCNSLDNIITTTGVPICIDGLDSPS